MGNHQSCDGQYGYHAIITLDGSAMRLYISICIFQGLVVVPTMVYIRGGGDYQVHIVTLDRDHMRCGLILLWDLGKYSGTFLGIGRLLTTGQWPRRPLIIIKSMMVITMLDSSIILCRMSCSYVPEISAAMATKATGPCEIDRARAQQHQSFLAPQ